MGLKNLLDLVAADQEREALIKTARARVDNAIAAHHQKRGVLERLERASCLRSVPEPALQHARDDVFSARTELHAARRALLASLQ